MDEWTRRQCFFDGFRAACPGLGLPERCREEAFFAGRN